MAADAYAGHADYSTAKAIGTNPDNAAPADQFDYDSTAYPNAPGQAARAGGWPRADGEPNTGNAR